MTRSRIVTAIAIVVVISAAVWTLTEDPAGGEPPRPEMPEDAVPVPTPGEKPEQPAPPAVAVVEEDPKSPPPVAAQPGRDLWEYLRRVNEAPSWRGASATVAELGKLPPDHGRALALELFCRVEDAYKREKAFDDLILRVRPPWMLDLLDAMANDEVAAVRRAAFMHLYPIAFRRFTGDDDAHHRWRETTRGRPVGEVWHEGLRGLVDRLRALDDADLSEELGSLPLGSMPLLPEIAGLDATACSNALEESGAVDLMLVRLTRTEAGGITLPARRQGWSWLAKAQLDSERAERWLAPIFARPEAFPVGTVGGALAVLGSATGRWPKVALAKVTAQELGMMHGGTLGMAWRGHIEDPTVIPLLIEALGTEGIPQFNARLAARLLAQATGAKEGADKDAEWWRTWWAENR
jgi:hypothetical protein